MVQKEVQLELLGGTDEEGKERKAIGWYLFPGGCARRRQGEEGNRLVSFPQGLCIG